MKCLTRAANFQRNIWNNQICRVLSSVGITFRFEVDSAVINYVELR